ncbi:MAG: ABC transporter substrate-binding protein [Lachnospiraceae bacterium]|nr:ABC transporter substrate-binding protein [Lachnospiraceae bacterium]
MKKEMMKKLLLAVVLSTLTIALSGCTGDKSGEENSSNSGAAAAETASASSITIGIPQDLEDSLDPHKAVAAGTKEVLFNVFEGLVKPDSDGNLNPAVASDYAISEDGKTYTFTLREGVKFHDGSTVTAADVKYSIERCADTSSGTPLVPAFSNITEVAVVGDDTIEIKLAEPSTDFLTYLTTAIIPEANQTPETTPIGTGPYKYVSRSPQEKIVMERFDEYWGEKANIKDVIFKVVANADTIVMELEGGGIDMFARVTPAQANQLSDKFNVEEGTMNLVQAVYLNHETECFKDARVRQALCYGLDRQLVLDFVSEGKGTIIGSSMFPAFGKYYMEELAGLYTKDVEKAKQLLTEAGYPDGITFTMHVPSNYQQHIDTAQVVAEQWKEIGVTANIELIEWDSWLGDVYTNRNYEATVVGVDAATMTAYAMLERFQSTSDSNFINYNNPEYDKAFTNAVSTVDDAKQTEYYKQCEEILAEDAANVYIQDIVELVAINKKYAGYEFYPLYVQDISKLYIVE